jgi:hypothetical protein
MNQQPLTGGFEDLQVRSHHYPSSRFLKFGRRSPFSFVLPPYHLKHYLFHLIVTLFEHIYVCFSERSR